MSTQVNWSKIKSELNKIADFEKLKSEVHKFSQEIRKFNIHVHLSPLAQQRLKTVEAKYQELAKSMTRTQRQLDREVNRVMRNLKVHREKAEQGLAFFKATAIEQKKKLEHAGSLLKKRVFKAEKIKKSKRKPAVRKKATKISPQI